MVHSEMHRRMIVLDMEDRKDSALRESEDVKDLHRMECSAALESSFGGDVVSSVDNGLLEAAEKSERMELGATTERSAK